MRALRRISLPLCSCLVFLLLVGCAGSGKEAAAGAGTAAPVREREDGPDFLGLLRAGLRNYESINDYTVHFTKQQRIRGKLLPEEEIFMKFKKPRSIYMKWTGSVDKGQEVLYVQGKYNGKMIAHKGWPVISRITVSLDPNGRRAMKKNLRPITCAGIGFLIRSLLDVSSRASESGDMKLAYHGLVDLPDGRAHKFERFLDERKGYPCYRAVIYLDERTGFPVLYEAYDREGNMLERYTFTGLKRDQGLGERDFDKRNAEYRFGFF